MGTGARHWPFRTTKETTGEVPRGGARAGSARNGVEQGWAPIRLRDDLGWSSELPGHGQKERDLRGRRYGEERKAEEKVRGDGAGVLMVLVR